ncbi:MAG TPA: hypothetical protein VEX11_15510 [Acetobacteraceae bacterium]|nr:hypothetical protein [Acetobacteraceae bacterium]
MLLALVVLEMARKMQTGSRPELPIDLPAALRQRGFLFLTWEVGYLVAKLPPIHKDPIDGAVADVVELGGGVVSGLCNEPWPAFERRRRPRHGQ